MYHHPNLPFFYVLEKETKLDTHKNARKVKIKQLDTAFQATKHS
jgi:hypothetical protein